MTFFDMEDIHDLKIILIRIDKNTNQLYHQCEQCSHMLDIPTKTRWAIILI